MRLVLNQIKRGMKVYLKRVKNEPDYAAQEKRANELATKLGIKLGKD